MKNYKMLVPIALSAIMFLSFYMLYSNRVSAANEYNSYLNAAREYAQQGILTDATSNYSKALNMKKSVELYLEIGDFYLDMDEDAAAITWGEKMLEEYPDSPEAYEYLLKIYVENQNYNKCYSLYSTFTKRHINSETVENIMHDIEYVYYLENEYEDVGYYSGGYCSVMTDGKWGYAGLTGSRTIAANYLNADIFIDETAAVTDINGESYFIDKNGNKKININEIKNIIEINSLTSDAFAANDGKKWTFYDSDYNKISESYDSVSLMGNGVAAVEDNGYWYLIDNTGQTVNSQKYLDVVIDGKGVVYRNEVLFVNIDGYYYLIDIDGNKISDEKYESAEMFLDNTYAAVKNSQGWYFIDLSGNSVFEGLYFDEAHSFSNGFAAVKQNGKWGFIDTNGKIVIDCVFEDAREFNSHDCVFVMNDGVWHMLRLYRSNYSS